METFAPLAQAREHRVLYSSEFMNSSFPAEPPTADRTEHLSVRLAEQHESVTAFPLASMILNSRIRSEAASAVRGLAAPLGYTLGDSSRGAVRHTATASPAQMMVGKTKTAVGEVEVARPKDACSASFM